MSTLCLRVFIPFLRFFLSLRSISRIESLYRATNMLFGVDSIQDCVCPMIKSTAWPLGPEWYVSCIWCNLAYADEFNCIHRAVRN